MKCSLLGLVQSGTAEVELRKGETIKLTLDDSYKDKCDEKVLWLDYKNITKVVQAGSHIFVDDGLISLKVKDIGKPTMFGSSCQSFMQILLLSFCLLLEMTSLVFLCLKATTT